MRPRLLTRSAPKYWAFTIVRPRRMGRALLRDARQAQREAEPIIAQAITIGGTLAAIRWLPKWMGFDYS